MVRCVQERGADSVFPCLSDEVQKSEPLFVAVQIISSEEWNVLEEFTDTFSSAEQWLVYFAQ